MYVLGAQDFEWGCGAKDFVASEDHEILISGAKIGQAPEVDMGRLFSISIC